MKTMNGVTLDQNEMNVLFLMKHLRKIGLSAVRISDLSITIHHGKSFQHPFVARIERIFNRWSGKIPSDTIIGLFATVERLVEKKLVAEQNKRVTLTQGSPTDNVTHLKTKGDFRFHLTTEGLKWLDALGEANLAEYAAMQRGPGEPTA